MSQLLGVGEGKSDKNSGFAGISRVFWWHRPAERKRERLSEELFVNQVVSDD
jgi:hypothetical protein